MRMALMGLGGVGLLSSLVWGGWPGVLGVLSLLGWTAGQALLLAWDAIKGDRELAARILGEQSGRIPSQPLLQSCLMWCKTRCFLLLRSRLLHSIRKSMHA